MAKIGRLLWFVEANEIGGLTPSTFPQACPKNSVEHHPLIQRGRDLTNHLSPELAKPGLHLFTKIREPPRIEGKDRYLSPSV